MRNAKTARQRSSVMPALLGTATFLAGFYFVLEITKRAIYRAEGYDAGDADCDDCGLTLLLDHVGWLSAAVGVYLVLVLACAAGLLVRRRRGHPNAAR